MTTLTSGHPPKKDTGTSCQGKWRGFSAACGWPVTRLSDSNIHPAFPPVNVKFHTDCEKNNLSCFPGLYKVAALEWRWRDPAPKVHGAVPSTLTCAATSAANGGTSPAPVALTSGAPIVVTEDKLEGEWTTWVSSAEIELDSVLLCFFLQCLVIFCLCLFCFVTLPLLLVSFLLLHLCFP